MHIIPTTTDHKEHNYLTGDCHIFAIALNRLTNYPLVSFYKRHPIPEEEWLGDEENDKYEFEHAHAAVMLDFEKGIYLDATGIKDIDKDDFCFMFNNEDTLIEIMTFRGEEDLASNFSIESFNEENIKNAIQDAKNLEIPKILEQYKNSIKKKRTLKP